MEHVLSIARNEEKELERVLQRKRMFAMTILSFFTISALMWFLQIGTS